jgi:hypothetical protein
MPVEEQSLQRLDHLIAKADEVRRTFRQNPVGWEEYTNLDHGAFMEWRAQSHSLLVNLLGAQHTYVENFASRVTSPYLHLLDEGTGILRAVREDVEGGYLIEVRTLISAEVFTDFLEMAEHLYENGYIHPAASLTGAVLEDGMRKIASVNNIAVRSADDLGALNQKLAQANVYNRLKQQQLQPLIRIRNHADHGEFEEYSADDVARMIRDVGSFLADYLR